MKTTARRTATKRPTRRRQRPEPETRPDHYSLEETGKILGFSRTTVRRCIADGTFQADYFGIKKSRSSKLWIPKDQVHKAKAEMDTAKRAS